MKKTKSSEKPPEKSADVPVTQIMLFQVRDELKEHIRAEIHGVNSKIYGIHSEIHEIKSEIHEVKSEIHEVKSEINGMKSEIHEIKSEIHEVKSVVHRVALLVEEQNARNRIVMDGLTSLFHRQDRVENKVDGLEKIILASKRP